MIPLIYFSGTNDNIEVDTLPVDTSDDQCSLGSSKISIHEVTEVVCEQFVCAFGRKGKQLGQFEDAKDITCLSQYELIITDLILGRLQKITKEENSLKPTLLAPRETTPVWATTTTLGGNIAATMYTERCVKVFNRFGTCVLTFGEQVLQAPRGITCDSKDRLIVTDEKLGMILMFEPDGTFCRFLGDLGNQQEGFLKPRYVCVNINHDILVSDSGTHSVKIFNSDGRFRKSFGSFGKKDGQLKCPYGLCTNSTGEILVADHYNNRISVFTKDGAFVRHVISSSHGLYHPQGVAIDSNNYLYITHGQFKATEILTFKLTAKMHEYDFD